MDDDVPVAARKAAGLTAVECRDLGYPACDVYALCGDFEFNEEENPKFDPDYNRLSILEADGDPVVTPSAYGTMKVAVWSPDIYSAPPAWDRAEDGYDIRNKHKARPLRWRSKRDDEAAKRREEESCDDESEHDESKHDESDDEESKQDGKRSDDDDDDDDDDDESTRGGNKGDEGSSLPPLATKKAEGATAVACRDLGYPASEIYEHCVEYDYNEEDSPNYDPDYNRLSILDADGDAVVTPTAFGTMKVAVWSPDIYAAPPAWLRSEDGYDIRNKHKARRLLWGINKPKPPPVQKSPPVLADSDEDTDVTDVTDETEETEETSDSD